MKCSHILISIFALVLAICVAIFLSIDFEYVGLINRVKKYHRNLNRVNVDKDSLEKYDYIVIGSGTAGSIMASRLSENNKNTVLLLEAGGSDNDFRIKVPGAFFKLFFTSIDWGYESIPQKELSKNIMHCPRGKVLGGSSSTNAQIYMRGDRSDYDNWESLGNKGWGWDDVLPYFKKSENNTREGIDERYHGKTGPWIISDPPVLPLKKDMSKAISETFNIPQGTDVNCDDSLHEGVYYNQFNIHNSQRHSLSDAFLNNDVLQRDNLYVKLNAHVVKILFETNSQNELEAKGVLVDLVNESEENRYRKIYANKEVILSAGSINSPQILMLSGVGPSEELKKHNIEVLLNSPQVGKNLQDHLTSFVAWEPINDLISGNHIEKYPWRYLLGIIQWLYNKTGYLTNLPCSLNGLIKSEVARKNNESAPDIQLTSVLGIAPYTRYEKLSTWDNWGTGIGISMTLLNPKSIGTVTLKSSNHLDHPIIDYNTYDVKEDEDRLIDAWKRVKEVGNHPLIKEKISHQILAGDYNNDEELKKMLHNRYFYLYHPVGTIAMGTVLDERLRFKGIKKLRVVDGSVMPRIVRANTNAPIAMIAEKASDMVKEDNV